MPSTHKIVYEYWKYKMEENNHFQLFGYIKKYANVNIKN